MERAERLFLISDVSAGNPMLCRGEHVAYELRVEWTWGKSVINERYMLIVVDFTSITGRRPA